MTCYMEVLYSSRLVSATPVAKLLHCLCLVYDWDRGNTVILEVAFCSQLFHRSRRMSKPRGSRYLMFQASGSTNQSRYGFWNREPKILGTWTLCNAEMS